MHVVVIDDEELIVRGLCEMIRRAELPATTYQGFDSAAPAMEYLTGTAVDLVFIDINMPGTDGLRLMETVRERGCNGRFVVLSGYQEFAYAQQAIRLGVCEYLVKPIDPADLRRILRAAFEEIYHVPPEEYAEMPLESMAVLNRDRSGYSRQLRRLLEHIDVHLLDSISLSSLGEFSGLHPNYISTLFMKEMNVNFMSYIHCMKLRRALEMLEREKALPITAIALQLGYYSERQFYRMFKRFMGITPGQYREQGCKL